uniref:Nebulin n=1 Tax=Oryzias latipes TaxID=8090 RepID=A0A3P9MGR8_ORYLA
VLNVCAVVLHQWKYREQYERAKDKFTSVLETPMYETQKRSKKISDVSFVLFIFLSNSFFNGTMEVNKLVSEKEYKAKFEKEKGKSVYNHMIVPPDIQHAMEVAKNQSNVSYAKASLHYTTVVDRPDIKKATQATKLVSEVKPPCVRPPFIVALHKPDYLQVKYKEKFDKEMKGKRPQYDMKESKIYKTLKDANELASEYCYKKKFEESKGHYHMIADTPEQLHLKEASELQSNVKYKEKYEKEKGKPMLDFETPTYVTAKEAQHMQSQVNFGDFEPKGQEAKLAHCFVWMLWPGGSVCPSLQCLCSSSAAEYKKSLEQDIKGHGMLALATDTPDFMRARNATDILSQVGLVLLNQAIRLKIFKLLLVNDSCTEEFTWHMQLTLQKEVAQNQKKILRRKTIESSQIICNFYLTRYQFFQFLQFLCTQL